MNVDAIKKPLRMITNEQIFRPTADFFLQKCLKKELTVQKQLQFKGNLGFKKASKISIIFRINFIKMIAFGLPRKIQKKTETSCTSCINNIISNSEVFFVENRQF